MKKRENKRNIKIMMIKMIVNILLITLDLFKMLKER